MSETLRDIVRDTERQSETLRGVFRATQRQSKSLSVNTKVADLIVELAVR